MQSKENEVPLWQESVSVIINGKYVNAVPLYRLEQEFRRHGLNTTKQNMVNWCIRLSKEYLSVLYEYQHKEIYAYHVIQVDENRTKAAAVIYSIVETAKSNNLKPIDYVQYLLEEITKHREDTDHSFLKNPLPWSETLPGENRKNKLR